MQWYWIVVLYSLVTTGFVILTFLAFSFSQTETERQLNAGSNWIHAEFESVKILNISHNQAHGYSRISAKHLASLSFKR